MPTPGELGSLNTKNWANLQELADSLEHAWTKGEPADLALFLPPPGTPTRSAILQELIKTDLGCRWRHGQAVLLDFYLEKFASDLGSTSSLPAALVYEEYRVRQLFGDRPALKQFQSRFPNQIAEVERLLIENPLPDTQNSETNSPTVKGPVPHASFGKNIVLAQTGGYTLLERIGTGGFAEVWKAKAPGGVLKAIKIIIRPIDQEESQREIEAMELIKNVRHHFLLPIHAFWPLEDRLIILMDLADGSLRDCLAKYRKEGKPAIPLPELMRYLRQTAEALDYLHQKKVQHRDIKPENILLTDGNVRVADFGLAKAQGTLRMVTGTFAGTPMYMPPETWEDKTHINGDQYSLAATFFELRTGRRLYKDSALPALMNSHLHETPNLAPLGKEEQQVFLKALAKNPEERFPNCLSFVYALEKAVAGELPVESFSLPGAPGNATAANSDLHTVAPRGSDEATLREASKPSPDRKRSWIMPILSLFAVLGLAALATWFLLGTPQDEGNLTILPLGTQVIRAGETTTIPVSIQRDHFQLPVQLKLDPSQDINAEEVTIPGNDDKAQLKIRVANQAQIGTRKVTLDASAGSHCAYMILELNVVKGE